MLPIVKRLLSLISIVTLFISCAFQESKTSNGEEASQVESYVRVLPKSELQFPGTNSVCLVTIESSDSWEISGTNDWCSVSSTQGYSGDRVVISVADNMHDDYRSVNLVVSCGDVETTICVVQDPKIETSYVDVGFDNGETISGYNKSTGEVTITYSNDNIPDVGKGNTIVLSDEYMFDIRVIESVSSDGDTFTYSTTQGNIWDVFSDASFTLASNDDILAMDIDGTPVVIPVAKGYLDANGKYVEVYNKYPSSTKTNKRVAQAKSAGYDLVAHYRAARDYDEHRGGPSPNAMPNRQYDYEYDYPYYDDYYDDYYYDYEEPDDTYMSVTEEESEIYFNNSSDNFTTGVEWNFRQDYSGLDIYNGDYGRLWMEKCVFDAGLSCTFEFKFGDSDSDSLFGMMGDLEYFSCMLRGSFGADLLLRYHYYDSMSYSDDKIVKYNVIPTQIYTFVICGVPVHLLIYTHLGQYAEMGLSSGIDASGGVDMGLDLEAGISWSKEDGVKFTKGATPHLTVYPLTLSANTSAYAKVSYYPQIEIGLYGSFGPWFEPRPYIKQEVETGFTLSTGDDYYDSWKSTLYGGLDMRMGLKVDFGFYDKDLWTSKVFSVVDDTPLYTAPKRISLESPSAGDIVVDVNESVNVSFKVDDYCSITDKYSKCSNAFVTFKANGGTLSKTYDATDSSGIANVRWTPFTSSSDTSSKTLTAYIYDGKGNIIDRATFVAMLYDLDNKTSQDAGDENPDTKDAPSQEHKDGKLQNPGNSTVDVTELPPNNQIWYTTSDDSVVDIKGYGSKIISNTNTNGKGIITFNDDVTEIRDEAFEECSNLTSITIPNSVTEIGEFAFVECSNLTSITIPNSVTEIGEGVFLDCRKLETFNGKYASNNGRCLINNGVLIAIAPGGLTEFNIPYGVTGIGPQACASCISLTNITIPNSVTSIGEFAFAYCCDLSSITIPNSVTEIGDEAFVGCSNLTSVTIPNSVTKIGCDAFWGCDSLISVTIPGSVNEMGDRIFSRCESLTNVTILNGVTNIGNDAFSDCVCLTSVTIPSSVTKIGDYAFSSCDNLTSITIPNRVIEIGSNAFDGCTSLKSVYCKAKTPPSLGEFAFLNFNNDYLCWEKMDCTIYVPRESVDAYKKADGWKWYAHQIVGYDF